MKEAFYEIMVRMRDFLRNPSEIKEAQKEIKEVLKMDRLVLDYGEEKRELDVKFWRKCISRFAVANPGNAVIMAHRLVEDQIKIRKICGISDEKSPVFICVVKNDKERIKKSYEYHRSLGLKNFVYLDNNSDDGTYEWLMEQDANVFWTDGKYCSSARSAWLMKIFEYFGYDRWYLILDADELLAYPHCEEHGIDELVSYLEEHKIRRMLSFMLDMYMDGKLSEIDDISQWDFSDYRYFDTDSYEISKNLHFYKINGGPRSRTFRQEKSDMVMIQNKYPLVYIKKGEIYRYHYMYPFFHNFDTECISAMLHYKFLPGDLKKYEVIAQTGNYANGSQLYKESLAQIKQNQDLNFWDEKSCEYRSSEDLLKIGFIKDIMW